MTDDQAAQARVPQPLPYLEITNQGYATLAAQNFTIEEPKSGTLVLRGPCPRCNAVIDVPVVSGIVRSFRLFSVRRPSGKNSAASHAEPMMCTCEDEHAGRPKDAYGCGAYWTLTLSRQDP